MKKMLVLALLSVMCLSGCSNNQVDGELEPPHIDDYEDDNSSVDLEEVEMKPNNIENSVIVADMIVKQNSGKNVMFSPTSLNFALGLVSEGSNDESKELLTKYLGTDTYGDFAKGYLSNITQYNSENEVYGYKTKLEIANALWVDDERTLKSSFETAADKYQAKTETLDFDKPTDACDVINSWSNEKTYGLIPEIVSSDTINSETEMVLTNSVYFESAWLDNWNFIEEDDVFTLSDGNTETTQYMHNSGGAYFENEKAIGFSSQYISGLEFIGILPKAEGDFSLEDLDIAGLLETRNHNYDELNCKMPKLAFDTTSNLTDILSAFGMDSLFTDDATIFDIADKPLKISNIIQKTRLELDDKGTKAAAVTAVSMNLATSMSPPEDPVIKEVYLDRPFAFLIYDSKNDEILFIGKVNTTKD